MSIQHDRRVVVYPHYITAAKTVAEGRRIPKELACDNPNVVEMKTVCDVLKLPCIIEDKHYPRDWFIRCRLRVQLKKEDGSFINPDIISRRTLLLKIAELQPQHKKPFPQGAVMVPAQKEEPAASSSAAQPSSSGSGKSKGKGKKK